PRNKPPFPVQAGLFGKPTVINNVETLVNVPPIILDGAEAFAGLGTTGSTGPKLFCLSGHIMRPGLYEVPFGCTLRKLIETAGGVPGGKQIQAILLGGAAGMFVGPDKLDVPLTFEATRAIGATVGSGVVMIFDETVDLAQILRRVAAFFRDESCGQCVPCRVGTVRQEELLARLAAGAPLGSVANELKLLDELAGAMRDASICGLGQTANSAIQSALAKAFKGYAQPCAAAPARFGERPKSVEQPVKVDNDLFVRDYAKCMLCYKCVEACGSDAQNTFAIAVAGRGFEAHISTEHDAP